MKLSLVIFSVLVACGVCYAVEHGPIINALQPVQGGELRIEPVHNIQKRGLLLGAGTAGLLGAGLAAGAVGLGAGLIGAKAGFVGGALAGSALGGRSYGGGYGHGYGGYGHGYGGYGGYGHGYGGYGHGYGGYGHGYDGYGYGGGYGHGGYGGSYRSYYPTTSYIVSDSWC